MGANIRYVAVNERGLRIGESHRLALLTDSECELVRQLHEDGMSYSQIATRFEVSKSCVAAIVKFQRRGQYPVDFKAVAVSE
jgi:DNA invertase Pin-like site-specific DNA recombinase